MQFACMLIACDLWWMCIAVSSAPAAAPVAAVLVVAHPVMDPAQNRKGEEEGNGAVKRGKLKSILSFSESPTLLPDQVYLTLVDPQLNEQHIHVNIHLQFDVQWNPSNQDSLKWGHLKKPDTFSCPKCNVCVQFNPWNQLIRTLSSVPRVSGL